MPAFLHVIPHAFMGLELSWKHPLSISAIREPPNLSYLEGKKKLLTEKRDKVKAQHFVVMGTITDYQGNTVKLFLFPKETYLPKSSYSRMGGPLTVPVRHPRCRTRS